jgi:excisionase family DNA binding protein
VPDVTVRTRGPAIVVVIKHEALPRLALVASGQADADALGAWFSGLPTICETLLAALGDLDARGGLERSTAWHEQLDSEDPWKRPLFTVSTRGNDCRFAGTSRNTPQSACCLLRQRSFKAIQRLVTDTASLEPLMSLADAAEMLGISRASAWRLVYDGELEVVAVGGRRLIEPAELRRFIAARRRRRKPIDAAKPGSGSDRASRTAGVGGGDESG